jgi:hypothetical protein
MVQEGRCDMTKLIFNRFVTIAVLGLLVAGGATMGYRSISHRLAADVYRERLIELAGQYERLRDTYNEVVHQTAVTELVVKDGALSVIVRNAEGVVREVPTPFDPASEIYVDFVIVDGRLWIRRIFDDVTPPTKGLVIDPDLQEVSWETERAQVGKAVYRALGEGRWVVTVTGNGSLGLERATGERVELSAPPEVSSPGEIAGEVDEKVGAIGAGDVWSWLFSGG